MPPVIARITGSNRREAAPAALPRKVSGNAMLRLLGIPVRMGRRLYAPKEMELVVAESAKWGR